MARTTETIMNEFNKPKLLSKARDKARTDARNTKNVARRVDKSDEKTGPAFSDKAKSAAKKADDRNKDRSKYVSESSPVGPNLGGKPTKNTVSYQMKKEDKPADTNQSFGSAFASARAAGKKTFEYKGKKYTTERADDKKSEAKTTPDGNMGFRTDFSDDKTGPNMSAPKKPKEPKKENVSPDRMQRQGQRGLTGYKAGGMIKTKASSRGDGCAVRGKTRA